MNPLYSYIQNKPDGHAHLFDIHGCIASIEGTGVGFPDISMRTESRLYHHDNVIEMYGKYMHRYPGYKILATAHDSETAIDVLKKFNLKGFGELKCYPTAKINGVTKQLPYKSEKYWKSLFEYANVHKLPVWIHWSLLSEDDYYNLESIIMHYPNAKFVICHCGIDTNSKIEQANTTAEACFNRCLKLLERFPNAYTDVSWTACEFLLLNPQHSLPTNKYIVGSDINPHDYRDRHGEYLENVSNYRKIQQRMGNPSVLLNIFNEL